MQAQKITISIPQQLYEFVEEYQVEHHCKSRSDVFSTALILLQEKRLQAYYLQANQELNNDFEATLEDGLDDEAW